MNNLENVRVGDKVIVSRYCSLSSSWEETVTELNHRYDRNSGEKYPIIILSEGQEFDATTGNAVKPATDKYICKRI